MNVLDRFLNYVTYDTQSSDSTGTTPSTSKQIVFAKVLVDELESIGMSDITIDEHGYVMATLASNSSQKVPTIGFIAHIDTSPDLCGTNVKPRVVKHYDGTDIQLNEQYTLKTSDFPEILRYKGDHIVVTDGTTLLGADDKAGIAEIMTAMEYLIQNPEIEHGTIRVAFTPDEEIGLGAHKFDVDHFGADWAYTMDGGEIGELEFENFNASVATVTIIGRNVHPGYAKNKMVNSIHIVQQFLSLLPQFERPEHTEHYEGFFHVMKVDASIEQSVITLIVRDHDRAIFEKRKLQLNAIVDMLNQAHANALSIVQKDQYFNMREKIEPHKHIVDLVEKSMIDLDITPKIKPIRGGTDGSQLSFKGLPCPNIFAGGHNFHGRFEFIPVSSMIKATNLIVQISNNLIK